jgi:hypothetical protein
VADEPPESNKSGALGNAVSSAPFKGSERSGLSSTGGSADGDDARRAAERFEAGRVAGSGGGGSRSAARGPLERDEFGAFAGFGNPGGYADDDCGSYTGEISVRVGDHAGESPLSQEDLKALMGYADADDGLPCLPHRHAPSTVTCTIPFTKATATLTDGWCL